MVRKIETKYKVELDNFEGIIIVKNDDFEEAPYILIESPIIKWRTYDDMIKFHQDIASKLIENKEKICSNEIN
jgi:hypothetical protein